MLSQKLIIKNYHDGPNNHRGVNETNISLTPALKTDFENYINFCKICKTNKYERTTHQTKFMITPTPSKPYTFQTPDQKFLTIVDSSSE